MWAAYFMPLEEGRLYSIVKHIYLSGRDGIRDKSLPGNFLILRIAVLVRIFPPCGNEIDQEGRNSHCNQRENDFSERNIGQRQCQHRHIRKEIGPGNFPSGYLGDYQRQSIIAAAGSPLPYYKAASDTDEQASCDRSDQWIRGKIRQHRRK